MSYAPASPDLSSFYSGSAPTQTTSSTATTTTQIGSATPLAPSGRPPLPLSPCAPPGLSLPVSPTPTTHYQQHQRPPQQYHNQQQQYTGAAQFPSHSQSHLDAPQQPVAAYSPKSPVSPLNRPAYPHSHAQEQQQIHAHYTHPNQHQHQQQQQQQQLHHQSPQSPPPRAPLQAAPLNYNTPHVASPAKTQFQLPSGAGNQPHLYQQQHYPQPESPQTPSYAPPPQNFAQHSGAFPTGQLHNRLEAPPHIKSEWESEYIKSEYSTENMPPRRSAAAATQPPPIDPSPVRTRFPTARIKRIMQADEEVGKVAQQTPIAVGKALELFMVALVSKSHDVARDKGAKRVTAQHLKQVVESDDQWDFLREIVGRVSETEDKSKAGRAKAESSSDEEPVEAKKKGRGGRKKKVAP